MLQRAARRTASMFGRESIFVNTLRPLYESVLEWSSGGRGIPWCINGVEYRIDPRQRHRLGQFYDAPVAAFLSERVKPGAICFDVGANVGVYVLQLSRWSAPTGHVVAFEPNPTAINILERHIRLNYLSERVSIVPVAVGAKSGESTLYAYEADGMSRLGAPAPAIAQQVVEITVPVITLDEYFVSSRLKPDWLLMDIEGFEIAALSGGRELIKELGDALGIIVEMHPNIWNSANTARADLEDLLSDMNLFPIPLTHQTDPLTEHGLVQLAHLHS